LKNIYLVRVFHTYGLRAYRNTAWPTGFQVKDLKDCYNVISFPHDEFTNDLIRLNDKQRKDFVRKFNEDRKNNRKINLLWL